MTLALALIDLDGTIADDRHRKHFAFEKRWVEYFAHDAILADTVWEEGRALIKELQEHPDKPKLAYLTGRRIDTKPATLEWLARNGFPNLSLFMKPLEVVSWTPQYKADLVARAQLTYAPGIVTLYDDDPAVVARVREACGDDAAFHCTWNPPWAEVSA